MRQKKPMELHPVKNRSGLTSFFRDLFLDKPPKLVRAKSITGTLSNPAIKSKVTKKINDIIRQSSNAKIGVMGDTSVRMDSKDYRGNYKHISRIYKTTSKATAIEYEVELIKKFKKLYPKKVKNISTIPAGRLTTYNGYYHIYVVFN